MTASAEFMQCDRERVLRVFHIFHSRYLPRILYPAMAAFDPSWDLWSPRAGLAALLLSVCLAVWRWTRPSRNIPAQLDTTTTAVDLKSPSITPLEGFDWETTEPLQFRPFRGKDKYNLTMGESLENLDPSELIPMDKTYKERLALRKSLLEQHHDIVVAVNKTSAEEKGTQDGDEDPRIRDAVGELYSFILGTYLPTRYPSMFRLHERQAPNSTTSSTTKTNNTNNTNNTTETIFENRVTGATWPTHLQQTTPTIHALEILAQTVDEEFLVLLPDFSLETEEEPKYILQAYATCFPSGFNTREKLGLRLADIHGPVPGYQAKLERSMDRFFARVEVGRFVRRVNWSVTTATELFAAFGGTHGLGLGLGGSGDGEAIRPGELDLNQTVLRCERQTLHRLPRSKALVFAFHTYTYPVRQIKDEGLGEELATAIDGLKKGNVPDMHSYKKGDVWGEALKDFLRS
ncbi:hypothetical protein NUU61_004773 [Penicillium alfredii]|uniref:Uncharacterized protein n=1 Tax=Penicillium alfredii TaxID=1506179 RepID=A0A9W9K7X1_9EURO|nr:uncharacterized protein NUU61_004773 [Penicillium alfredii]KAJ5095417.1 hypothetical protein NUU61_004773 [Penicillium alfredii]